MALVKRRSKRNWEHGYRSPQAAKAAHPRLDPSATIHLVDVQRLRAVGFINYPKLEHVECRLERDGKVCETDHGRGILVEAPGDIVSHVGWCCYEDYLEEHVEFKAGIVELDRMYRAADLEERLAVYLKDDAFLGRVEALRERRARIESRLNHIKSNIPSNMLRRLDEVRRSASHQVAVRTYRRRLDKSGNEVRDEVGKPVIESRRVVVGQFTGLRALDHSTISELADTFGAIALALEKARHGSEPSARKVDKWVQAFDRLPAAERAARRLEAALDEFMTGTNLELLRFVGHYVGQPRLGFIAIATLTGQTALMQTAAERAAHDWIEAICRELECDRFESHGV